MKKRRLGKSDMFVSEISMGGSVPTTQAYGTEDFDNSFCAAFRTAYEHGVNFFDNAAAYGNGYSERLLAKALGDVRRDTYIASKVPYESTRKEQVRKSCENSLKNLNTEYIDVLYLHFPNNDVPIEESIGALMDLKQEGKIRAIGVSNFSLSQLREACRFGDIDVLQTCYSLLWRKYVERELQPFCSRRGISIVPFSPLASGLLTGKFHEDWSFREDDQRARVGDTGLVLFQKEWWSKALAVVEELKPVARKYGKTMAQLSINWLSGRTAVCSVTSGAKNAQQIIENIGSTGWEIEKQDLLRLDQVSKGFTDQLPDYLHFFLKMVGTNSTVTGQKDEQYER